MTEKRKVIVDGVEFEVEIDGEGPNFTATVEGKSFHIEIPDAAPVAKKSAEEAARKRKVELFLLTSQVKWSPLKLKKDRG